MASDGHVVLGGPDGRRGTVYLIEDTEPGGWCVATVSGYWASDDEPPIEELSSVTVDEALAWGRASARSVYLLVGDQRYSAGSEPVLDNGVDVAWPDSGIVLEPRFHYEPAGAPRAAAWWVRLSRDGLERESAEDLARELDSEERVLATRIIEPAPPVIDLLIASSDDERVDFVVYRAALRAAWRLNQQRNEAKPHSPADVRWVRPEEGRGDDIEIIGPA